MLKRTITYVDYDGNERTEEFMFNINKSELTTMQMSYDGGLRNRLKKMMEKQNAPEIMKTFRDLIHLAYGEKSPDGRRFIKSDELSTAFEQTEAYNILFMELCTDSVKAAKWIEKVLPPDLAAAAAPEMNAVTENVSNVTEIPTALNTPAT